MWNLPFLSPLAPSLPSLPPLPPLPIFFLPLQKTPRKMEFEIIGGIGNKMFSWSEWALTDVK